jgi:hypothetical protein
MAWIKYSFIREKGIMVYDFLVENGYEKFHCVRRSDMYHFHILIDDDDEWIVDKLEGFNAQKEELIAKKIEEVRSPYPDRELYSQESIMMGSLARELLNMYYVPWCTEIIDIDCSYVSRKYKWVTIYFIVPDDYSYYGLSVKYGEDKVTTIELVLSGTWSQDFGGREIIYNDNIEYLDLDYFKI